MLKQYGIQCNKSILHSINAFNHHSIAYKENVSYINDIIARDDDNNRLVRLVSKLGLVVRV